MLYSIIYLFTKWLKNYLLTCEAGKLGSFTAYIVVRVESFESVYQDHWLDSEMSFLHE